MGIPWDRHNLLWDGMGWDRKICPMDKPVDSTTWLLDNELKCAEMPPSCKLKTQ